MTLDLQSAWEVTWQKFQDKWNRRMLILETGGDGFNPLPGGTSARLHSVIQSSGALLHTLIESLDGELQLPTIDAFLSFVESEAAELEDSTCTVFSTLAMMDCALSMINGEQDTVTQVFADFNKGGELQTTLQNTPLKKRLASEPSSFVVQEKNTTSGKDGAPTKKKSKKRSVGKKSSPKKRQKIGGKKAAQKKKKSGSRTNA